MSLSKSQTRTYLSEFACNFYGIVDVFLRFFCFFAFALSNKFVVQQQQYFVLLQVKYKFPHILDGLSWRSPRVWYSRVSTWKSIRCDMSWLMARRRCPVSLKDIQCQHIGEYIFIPSCFYCCWLLLLLMLSEVRLCFFFNGNMATLKFDSSLAVVAECVWVCVGLKLLLPNDKDVGIKFLLNFFFTFILNVSANMKFV